MEYCLHGIMNDHYASCERGISATEQTYTELLTAQKYLNLSLFLEMVDQTVHVVMLHYHIGKCMKLGVLESFAVTPAE